VCVHARVRERDRERARMPQWELGSFRSPCLAYLNVTSQNSVAFTINKWIFHIFASLLAAICSSRSSRSHGSHISSVSNAGLPADWDARVWSPFSTVCCVSGTVRLKKLLVFFTTYMCTSLYYNISVKCSTVQSNQTKFNLIKKLNFVHLLWYVWSPDEKFL
jgi:hypothetical protein